MVKILEIISKVYHVENQPRVDQLTSSDRSIKKRGRLVLQKCPGNVLKPFCGNVLTPLMSGFAFWQFSRTTFSLKGNLIIKSWRKNTVWVKSRRSKTIVCNCLICENSVCTHSTDAYIPFEL